MNAEFLNPVLRSLAKVLKMMAQLDAKVLKPGIKSDAVAKGEVTGIIEVKGANVNGSLSLTFSKALILELARRMLRMQPTEIDETVKDLAGEMTNMVIGGAKSEMDDKGYRADMSTPRVVAGKNHTVVHNIKAPTMIIPYETAVGNMYIELCFEEMKK